MTRELKEWWVAELRKPGLVLGRTAEERDAGCPCALQILAVHMGLFPYQWGHSEVHREFGSKIVNGYWTGGIDLGEIWGRNDAKEGMISWAGIESRTYSAAEIADWIEQHIPVED